MTNPLNEPDRILIRFNTKWKEDPSQRKWRVLVNGVEFLASCVYVNTFAETIEEQIDGELKFHFLCFGKVYWDANNARIEDWL